ncbi:MAG: hypothetical protein U0175_26120 [Caldilineaceae bacterium]
MNASNLTYLPSPPIPMTILTNQSGQSIVLTQELGRGGEGAVFAVANRNEVVAKVYHPEYRTSQRQSKLTAMVANPPANVQNRVAFDHPSLAWPSELLFQREHFVGFLMPRIDHCPNIFEVYNPKLRTMRYPKVNRRFLHHAARNLAIVLAGLHSSGYVMGDVNQKNILVNPQALVTLVDADSFQVRDQQGTVYRCPVGVPEYTPPELQDKVLAQTDRQPAQDCFGMSVLLFQLLMEGYHPFTGRPIATSVADVSQLCLYCIRWGIFPYESNREVQPPPGAPSFFWLHPDLQQLFIATFLLGRLTPEMRPNALAWARALERAEESLVRCSRNPGHIFSSHLEICPYCPKTKSVAIPAHPANSQGNYASQSASQGIPLGCWWDIAKAICLPFIVILSIPLLIWLAQNGAFGFLVIPFALLFRFNLHKKIGPWLRMLFDYSVRGMQLGYRFWSLSLSQDMKLAIGASIVVSFMLVLIGLANGPLAHPAISVVATKTPAGQMVSPLAQPLSPLRTADGK